MAYVIEERLEGGQMHRVGDPVEGLMVAKAVAAKSASQTGRLTLVKDESTGNVLERYEAREATLPASVARMRASNDKLSLRLEQAKKRK